MLGKVLVYPSASFSYSYTAVIWNQNIFVLEKKSIHLSNTFIM